MSDLHVTPVQSPAEAEDWRRVHNQVIPADPLSPDEVRDRLSRNRLEVAYLDGVAVGCTTVRPPTPTDATATVIVRVLPPWRRRGFGGQLYARSLAQARALGADRIETIVWESNVDGTRFAYAQGFAEVSRYLPEGEDVAYVTMRLS
ncbi:N-acetyltransferase family protein [Micromonospora sp. MS34]|uniref:GNAT family N-acetyltransferase n=1 Tax=Micromonospora sp. MS34 TaxID=3385971 RepID=UPI0039A2D174